ncbi:dynein regulatory complex subunit 4-like%2C partial [Scomber scombrus]|uniref:Dynein regulatory complex subunit 4-like, partial n=1 Tax=Scomber scombrus TaxID=13677 RepID=A0AAV1PL54_SCOSC
MQMDMAERSLDKTKREMEEVRARVRECLREKLERRKRHEEEKREREEELKVVQSGHAQEITELKMANFASKAEMLVESVTSEVQLLEKGQSSHADQRDKETAVKILNTEIKKKHQKELEELINSYDMRARELENRFLKQRTLMFESNMKKVDTELKEADNAHQQHCQSIMAEMEQLANNSNELLRCKQEVAVEKAKLEKELEEDERRKRHSAKVGEERQKLLEHLKSVKEHRHQLPAKYRKELSGIILEMGGDLIVKYLDLKEVQRETDHIQNYTDVFFKVYEDSGSDFLARMTTAAEVSEEENHKVWLALAVGKQDLNASKKLLEHIRVKRARIRSLKRELSEDLKEYDKLVTKARTMRKSLNWTLPRIDVERALKSVSNDLVVKLTHPAT